MRPESQVQVAVTVSKVTRGNVLWKALLVGLGLAGLVLRSVEACPESCDAVAQDTYQQRLPHQN